VGAGWIGGRRGVRRRGRKGRGGGEVGPGRWADGGVETSFTFGLKGEACKAEGDG